MITQEYPEGLSPQLRALSQAIEKVFASRGLKCEVSYEKAGQFSAIIPVKLTRKTESTKKD
ncbi:MAG: hypothetical protein Q4C01_03005 [Clostridia bacterium]|nr:hypothetical protein [Clostridia bacterium]